MSAEKHTQLFPQARVAGIRFHSYEKQEHEIEEGDVLELRRDADNQYDPNAVAVFRKGAQIGFVEKNNAPAIAAIMDFLPGEKQFAAKVVFHDTSPATSDYNRLAILPYLISEHADIQAVMLEVLKGDDES